MKLVQGLVMVLAFITMSINNANAQKEDWGSDSLKCRECLSLYGEPLNHGNYVEARKHWKCVVEVCPKIKESIYINGAIIYRHFIDKEADGPAKEKLIDSLVWIYEKRMEYFGATPDVLESYGNDMLRYRQSKPEICNGILKKLIDDQKGKSSAVAIMRYYQSLYLMYRNKAAGVDNTKMMEDYFRMKDYLDAYKKSNPSDPNITLAEEQLDKYGAPFLKCDDIYAMASKKFASVPKEPKAERLEQMKKLLAIMNAKGCSENDIYEKITEEVHKAEPSHESAYSLGVVKLNSKKYSEANTYFKQAIELCNGCDKEGDYLIGVAKSNLVMGNSSTAASYARQAMAKDAKLSGQAYMVIAKAIVSSQCGESEYSRKYLYVLAVDYLLKAKAADASLSGDANALIGNYKGRYPTKTEIFEHSDLDKETYSIGCWIGENVRIPKD